eukprot:Protomagalhaensia_sp_Gyna_25__5988@NODE_932_length_2396_cov_269_417904_g738_i0_p1_GENE_NODE_932_length_2396_cov_269_417904_g738_i0NODE_932_length_2396_cov_269_417904_g738_i0_p1_ORF_typecomplete_len430_score69_18WD40/PF00400_32/0_013WD40/PF00400_32/1_6e06WD40/PF00400_32/4_9WD40/PF00400_32/0_00076WD40/PF00400_32/8_5e03ANAPC4_WD40/PF12894_7/0_025ANAPC4_WD40/PF12894_7/2e10ANAPC4_WD40/PF12894_7/0_023eIF2A/PF08662_11/21eIF2A/PF08662_11/0_00036eIF2A/PF08662_11/0_033CAF1C_H4bd/PF12265_8/1_7e06CAF1C_H4bd
MTEEVQGIQLDDIMSDEDKPPEGGYRLFRPNVDTLEKGEQLVVDDEFYSINHSFGLGLPCVSFDIVQDNLGAVRTRGPHTLTLVAGTQAAQRKDNGLIVAKATGIRRTFVDEQMDEDDDRSDDASEEGYNGDVEPKITSHKVCFAAEINSVKVSPHQNWLVATFTDDATVSVHSIRDQLRALDNPSSYCNHAQKPLYSHSLHTKEGFALQWAPLLEGVLASGSRDHTIQILRPVEGGFSPGPQLRGHEEPVEGLAWKFDDANILASGSVDKSIQVWDLRTDSVSTTIANAHNGDVNTLQFNRAAEPFHLLSGGDDGCTIVRDIRMPEAILASYDWHKEPVCAVDWHPADGSMYLSAGYDNQLVIWSLDVENADSPNPSIPDQLLFQHLGLDEVTHAKWHPQIPGLVICNGSNGFSLFKPINAVFGLSDD